MKSILTLILATFLLIPLQAQEKVYTVDNLPKVHLQNKMQYVCNPAGIADLRVLYRLNHRLRDELHVVVDAGKILCERTAV